jgi:hypothetical protein
MASGSEGLFLGIRQTPFNAIFLIYSLYKDKAQSTAPVLEFLTTPFSVVYIYCEIIISK